MLIQTLRFGEIEVDDSRLILLEQGLLGFPEDHQYCLLDTRPDSPLRWLQSAERPELAFLVVDPYDCFTGYEIDVEDAVADELELRGPEEAAVLALVSVQEGPSFTANLLGPVVINTRTGRGRQIVLDSERYTTRHELGRRKLQPAESAA